MARTIDEIQAEIITTVQADAQLSEASSTSSTALWRLFARVVAMAIATLENLFDLYLVSVNQQIELMKPHTAYWYQAKCLAYLHGYSLIEGQDAYAPLFDPAAQIVSAAAAVESGGILTLKVAKGEVDLTPLSVAEYAGFSAYIAEIKDAGVQMQILSAAADKMKLTIDVYYEPLILAGDGSRLDGTDTTPVKDVIKDFLLNLPFDGEFVKSRLTDAMQAVDGVFVPEIRSCKATRFDNAVFGDVDITYSPYSGFIRVYNDSDYTINYIPNV